MYNSSQNNLVHNAYLEACPMRGKAGRDYAQVLRSRYPYHGHLKIRLRWPAG